MSLDDKKSTRQPVGKPSERGQILAFFIFIFLALGLLTAVGLEVGRIVYARGEVGKAADAAALAAASRIDIPTYRETGQITFLPDARSTAQQYASMNANFLRSRGMGVRVTQIWIDLGTRVVYVTVAADLSALLPGFLGWEGVYSVTGFAEGRVQGRR